MAGAALLLKILGLIGFRALAQPAQTCLIDLEGGSLAGPNSCTPTWAGKDAALTQCFHECIAVEYQLEGGFDKSKLNLANAHPKKGGTCSNAQRPLTCPAVVLTCSKPFGEFPNACSGKAELKEFITTFGRYYLAFYAFGNATTGGAAEAVLATRVVGDAETICSGTYTMVSGSCLGLHPGASALSEAVAPPEPPEIFGMPMPFPQLGADGRKVTKTSTTITSTTRVTRTRTTTLTGQTTAEPTEKPTLSPPRRNGGHGLLIGGAVVVLILLAVLAFLWMRRGPGGQEARPLRASQEIEIRSANQY